MSKTPEAPKVPQMLLYNINLWDTFVDYQIADQMDVTLEDGNRIVVTGTVDERSMRNTNIGFRGRNNTICLRDHVAVKRLDIGCDGGSTISIRSPYDVRGATIVSRHGNRIDIGEGCFIENEVLVHAGAMAGISDQNAPESDGDITVKDHVWIGMGCRISSGAKIGQGSAIGPFSVLTTSIPNNCAASGHPCRVTDRDVFWAPSAGPNYFDMLKREGLPFPKYIRSTDE